MNTVDTPFPAPARPDQDDALRARSWSWLLDLRKRLNVGVQLVDTRCEPVLPQSEGAASAALTQALAAKAPPLRLAMTNTLQQKTPHAVVIETLQVHCFPLTSGRNVVGVLVAAREALGGTAEAERTRGELELIGSTLASAAEAHLAAPAPIVDARGDVEQIAALARLIGEGDQRTDRQLIESFAEALAVWHDVEVRAFVETETGKYELEVALPGARKPGMPLSLPAAGLPTETGLVPLSNADEDRFGLVPLGRTFVARVATGLGSWLLLFSGRPDTSLDARLAVYAQLLKDRLSAQAAQAAARLSNAMARELLRTDVRPHVAAEAALDALVRVTGETTAVLSVISPTGVPMVRAGRGTVAPGLPDSAQLVLQRRSPNHPVVTLALARPDGRPLTALDRELAVAAADLLEPWGASATLASTAERREFARGVDDVLEGFAERATQRGLSVSAVVLSAPLAIFRPGLTQSWVSQARAIMRASDIVGMLGEGELGFLLHDTTAPQAEQAAARLKQLLAGDDPSMMRALSFGVATRVPGLVGPAGIVQEARDKASTHADSSPDAST